MNDTSADWKAAQAWLDVSHGAAPGTIGSLAALLAKARREGQAMRQGRYEALPLWVIFGAQEEPQIMCCKLLAYTKGHVRLDVGVRGPVVCIWGYSMWRRTPGFRTLGIDVEEWCARSPIGPYFYADQARALEHLGRLTTPKAGAS